MIQGMVTVIGFIGAGTILKLNEQREIQGLTTAAGLWMTAAIGVAAGLGCRCDWYPGHCARPRA